MGAQGFYECVRGSWSVKIICVGVSMQFFARVPCRASLSHASEDLNVLCKAALSLLRFAENPRQRGRKKRFADSMNPDYMFDDIFGK